MGRLCARDYRIERSIASTTPQSTEERKMSDPWTNRTWQLQAIEKPIEKLLLPAGPNTLSLHAVKVDDEIVRYDVEFLDDEMAECWEYCKLYPRGKKAVPQLDTPIKSP